MKLKNFKKYVDIALELAIKDTKKDKYNKLEIRFLYHLNNMLMLSEVYNNLKKVKKWILKE